jgi:hypothetical protein
MRLLIFAEGTVVMHPSARGRSREERVRQIKEGTDSSIFNWSAYIPVGNAVGKLQKWQSQGAGILYLTSRTKPREIEAINRVLQRHGFPEGPLLFRQASEEYKDVVERTMPNILIEDDCESIGGMAEMTSTHIRPELKEKITSIVVKEFGGVDHLPDDLESLKRR